MQLYCPFVFAVISPVIARKTKVDRCAVNSIQRIFELEFMFRSVCHNAIKEFFKQCFEYFRITAVHRFGKCGFCHGFHAKVIKPFVVGKQSVFNFTQRIFPGDLSKEQGQKLFSSCKMLAIPVSAGLIYDFFKTISGNEVEKLRIDAIIIHCSGLSCQILRIWSFLIYNKSRQFQLTPVIFTGQ